MKENLIKLRKNWEFKRVYKTGRRLSARYGILCFRKNGLEYNRYGFSISKKVGGSVCRHHVKRIYFEVFRRMQNNINKGFDIVIVARKPAAEMGYHDCRRETETILSKAHLWKNEGE